MKPKLTREEFIRQIEASKIYLLSKTTGSGYDLNKNCVFKSIKK